MDRTKDTKQFCKECPVVDLCKTYAIAHDEYGIWGGLSRYQRQHLGPTYSNFIRLMYYRSGVLEYRSSLQEWIEEYEKSQQVQSSPNVLEEIS